MQAKKEKPKKKINPRAQAPKLIKEIKHGFKLTQDDLATNLKITQQAVSDYEAGYVWKERFDVINTLKEILAGNISPKRSQSPAEKLAVGDNNFVEQRIRERLIGVAEKFAQKKKR